MSVEAFVVDAFTDGGRGGNPAGIVLDAGRLETPQMQSVAARLGFSETAFVSPSTLADFRLRFFTPVSEVDLCGHATIAGFALLLQKGRIQPGAYSQETAAGILPIQVEAGGRIFMDQALPVFSGEIPRGEAAKALGLRPEDVVHPPQIVSTGLRDVIVGVRDRETLDAMRPDMKEVKSLGERWDGVGMHVFALSSGDAGRVHCRNFAPGVGIDEEAATGTANGALACYLAEKGLLREGELVVEQGACLGSPSRIHVKLSLENGRVTRVRVGGQAVARGAKNVSLD